MADLTTALVVVGSGVTYTLYVRHLRILSNFLTACVIGQSYTYVYILNPDT